MPHSNAQTTGRCASGPEISPPVVSDREHQPREQAAGQAAEDSRDRRDHQRSAETDRRRHRSEVDIISGDAEAGDSGDQDRGHDQQRHALLEGIGEFLDGEGDSGERRVECARHAGGAARDDDSGGDRHPEQAMHPRHDRGGDLDCRPLTPDRRASEEAGGGHQ